MIRLVFACATVLLAGPACMLHQPAPAPEPAVPAPDAFTTESPGPAPSAQPALPRKNWWEHFGDAELNQLTESALQGNLDVVQVAARVEQAEARLHQVGARLLPSLDGTVSVGSAWRQRFDEGDSSRRTDSAHLGGLLNWEIDLWGRLRSARAAQAAELAARRHDLGGARLILTAAVAETYFELSEQYAQLALVEEQIGINRTLLDLTELRFGQGQSSVVDVLQQREQLAFTRALVPTIKERLALLRHRLDVLAGAAPGSGDWQVDGELEPPPPLPVLGVPVDLLANRPDVAAARERLTAIDYQLGEAMAARLPSLAVGGSALLVGDPGLDGALQDLFASVTGPLFDGGFRKAVVTEQRARVREAWAEFSQAYLIAVEEVEGALAREAARAEEVGLLENQLEVAQRLLAETRNRYAQGLTDYLPVVSAVVTEQNLQRRLLTARREWLTARVELHRATGGPVVAVEGMHGWQSSSGRSRAGDGNGEGRARGEGKSWREVKML